MPDLSLTILDDLAVLSARGADTVTFLQGQLSQDITLLARRNSLLAGLHNPQGRCVAVLRLIKLADDHVLMVLPEELADPVRTLLSRYVLRSKVKIEDVSPAWRIYGVSGPDAAAAASTRIAVSVEPGGLRQLIVAPRNEPLPEGERDGRDEWRRADIAAGLPEIVAATSGLFIAQMLNLDRLDAISFEKGCYTGQEIIARAHYRGTVKRRMQRFATDSEQPLEPGDKVQLADGRNAQIVMATHGEMEGQEFLAVTTLGADPGADIAESSDTPDAALFAVQLPLPYTF
jgi:tRNA-modifying protein YgfZ